MKDSNQDYDDEVMLHIDLIEKQSWSSNITKRKEKILKI